MPWLWGCGAQKTSVYFWCSLAPTQRMSKYLEKPPIPEFCVAATTNNQPAIQPTNKTKKKKQNKKTTTNNQQQQKHHHQHHRQQQQEREQEQTQKCDKKGLANCKQLPCGKSIALCSATCAHAPSTGTVPALTSAHTTIYCPFGIASRCYVGVKLLCCVIQPLQIAMERFRKNLLNVATAKFHCLLELRVVNRAHVSPRWQIVLWQENCRRFGAGTFPPNFYIFKE